jgi:O-antigen ligase
MPLPRHPYLDPSRVRHDLERARAVDPFGDRVHTGLALLWCLCLGFPTSVVEIASIPLIVFFLLRTPKIWRTWGSFAVQPLTLAVGAWVVWQALTLLWTPDLNRGLQELAANRWVWAIWMLWPVMHHRPGLIAAICVGFLLGNLSQAGHALGKASGIEWLTWPRLENRNSGWWDPVVGGSLLTGVLGLHLPAALMGAGRARLLGLAGGAITLVAIFATGTRGAWIASGLLIGVSVLAAAAQAIAGRGKVRRGTFGVVAVMLLVLAVAGALLRGTIVERYQQGRREVGAALRSGDYASDTGKRLLMWRAAAQAAASNPVLGVGAGGYREWSLEHVRVNGAPPPADAIHVHAHSAPLHIAATTGALGLALAGAVLGFALVGGLRELRPAELGTYAAGPVFGIAGLMLAGLFDPVHLNAQTAALLFTFLALCFESRPGGRAWESGPGPRP